MTVKLTNFRRADGKSGELFYSFSQNETKIIGKDAVGDGVKVVNCEGKLLLPAFTDVGCEFSTPNFPIGTPFAPPPPPPPQGATEGF